MNVLELDKVSLEYAKGKSSFSALSDISLVIKEGEFLTIVGPSGCGKSSLLGLLAGTLLPTRGEVRYQGRPITGPGIERGLMLQQATLFPWLTAMENVAFGLHMQGVSKRERCRRAFEMLRSVGLALAGNRYPYELSGGMKQRAALARTLITDPAVVLMDEPLAALDAFTKRRMHELFGKVWKETGKTFVMVTHDVEEAAKLGTKMLVMGTHPGRIIDRLEVGGQTPGDPKPAVIRKVFELLQHEDEP